MNFKELIENHQRPPEEILLAAKLVGDYFRSLNVNDWKLLHVQKRVDTDSEAKLREIVDMLPEIKAFIEDVQYQEPYKAWLEEGDRIKEKINQWEQ